MSINMFIISILKKASKNGRKELNLKFTNTLIRKQLKTASWSYSLSP